MADNYAQVASALISNERINWQASWKTGTHSHSHTAAAAATAIQPPCTTMCVCVWFTFKLTLFRTNIYSRTRVVGPVCGTQKMDVTFYLDNCRFLLPSASRSFAICFVVCRVYSGVYRFYDGYPFCLLHKNCCAHYTENALSIGTFSFGQYSQTQNFVSLTRWRLKYTTKHTPNYASHIRELCPRAALSSRRRDFSMCARAFCATMYF